MPKLWRYLFSKYIQIFSLSIFSFIAILLVSRFKEVARFAAVTADWGKTALFMAYQIPTILPLAAPISAFIASFFLMQRLDRGHELSAMRASGLSLKAIFLPLFLSSLFLSVFHFSLCAELAPYCRLESRALLYRETSANPLLLLHRQRLVKIPNVYLKMKVKEDGKVAHDLFLVGFNEKEKRLSLLTARKLRLDKEKIYGEKVSLITPFQKNLLIENQGSLEMRAPYLSKLMRKNRPTLDATTFSLKMLRLRSQEWGKSAKSAQVEIMRRITLSLSLLSFTLLGFAFGIQVGRVQTKQGMVKGISLVLIFLICYLFGRGFKQELLISTSILLLPHPFIWGCSLLHLRNITRGRI